MIFQHILKIDLKKWKRYYSWNNYKNTLLEFYNKKHGILFQTQILYDIAIDTIFQLFLFMSYIKH